MPQNFNQIFRYKLLLILHNRGYIYAYIKRIISYIHHIYICMYIYTRTCIYMYMYICIHIYWKIHINKNCVLSSFISINLWTWQCVQILSAKRKREEWILLTIFKCNACMRLVFFFLLRRGTNIICEHDT